MSITYRVHNGGFITTANTPIIIEEGTLTIPAGTLTDLASIPRILWWIPGFACFELGIAGPLLHDAVYRGLVGRTPPIILTRRRADRVFHTLMRHDGVGCCRAWVAWCAVRCFGVLAWRRLPRREDALRRAR